ncbi:hypothetical protein GCM10009808_17090 [Microbacterium sediminicola]|uniref:Uncharacterized protein n=1 Tax=Microbacterium sediminicola TaxID=415210 RepID=A0ABP4UAA7_9MICO
MLVVRIDEVDAQTVRRTLGRTALPGDQLQSRGRTQHTPLDELRADRPTDIAGGSEDCDIHGRQASARM